MKKLLALILVVGMVLPMISAIAVAEKEEKIQLHFISRRRGEAYEENQVKKIIEEKFNVEIKWEILPSSGYQDNTRLVIASGDYPDMMEADFANAEEEILALAEEGLILPLNDLLETYGQNILAARPHKENWLRDENGKIWSIPCRFQDQSNEAYTIRRDWLDALGLDPPQNFDELYEVCRAFTYDDPDKDGRQNTYGLGGSLRGTIQSTPFSMFLGAYGVTVDWAKENDVWMPWELRAGTKEAIREFRRFVKDGLIDPDFYAMKEAETREHKNMNMYGVELWPTTQTGGSSDWWKAFVSAVPQAVVEPLPPISVEGHEAVFPRTIDLKTWAGMSLLIFSNCEHPELVMQIIDYLASPEGGELVTFGPEGVTWDDVDGKVVYRNLTTEEIRQSGQLLYYCVFWYPVFKRDTDPLVFAMLDSVEPYMQTSPYFPKPSFDGDVVALTAFAQEKIVSMILNYDSDLDAAFESFRHEYLDFGGDEYIDYYNAGMAAAE